MCADAETVDLMSFPIQLDEFVLIHIVTGGDDGLREHRFADRCIYLFEEFPGADG